MPLQTPFAWTFSTMPFEHSTFRWFAYFVCTTYAVGLLPSFIQHWKELYIQFIRDTPNKVLESYDRVALLIDESAHRKKGQHSVGVARQWCGTIGKVDNCQVAVYAALSAEKYYGLIDSALYLPQSWTEDKERCRKAKVPKDRMTYKTKVELALDIVKP